MPKQNNEVNPQLIKEQIQGKLMDRDWREQERMRELSQTLPELTLADLGSADMPMNGSRTVLSERDIYAGLSEEEKAIVKQNSQFDGVQPESYQTREIQPRPQPVRQVENVSKSTSWTIKELNGKLKSGASIPVWKVLNSKTGMNIETPFRIQEVAEKIAKVLNETGNMNDSRITGTIAAYNRRIDIVREMRVLKEGKGSANELKALKDELYSIDFKLGI